MRIFSSFDTKLKARYVAEYTNKYGKENIFVMYRSSLYFYYKVLLRIIYGLLLHGGFAWAIYALFGRDEMVYYGLSLGFFIGLVFYIIAISNYIDYIMDFAIFTPDEAMLIQQNGFFNRDIKSLDLKKAKSISTQKPNLLFSIFNNGILTVLSEGQDTLGDIRFKYVHNPEHAKELIHRIIINSPYRKTPQSIHNL